MRHLPFVVDPGRRVVVITWPDVTPTVALCSDTLAEIERDPLFSPDFGVVSDRRQLTNPPDTAFVVEFLRMLEKRAAEGRFRGRWATVAPATQSAVYGMARMTEIRGEDLNVSYRAFRKFEEALEWATSRVVE